MTTGRYRRRNPALRPTGSGQNDRENNFFLGTIGFSLFVHILAAAIFSHTPTTTIKRRPPTLYVDLVMAPVANPQRGSASAIKKVAEPVAVAPQPALPTKTAKKPVAIKAKETKKPAKLKVDDMAKEIAKEIAADMAKMKERKTERDELKAAQAAIDSMMKKKTTSVLQAAATVGSANGSGDEAGVEIGAWLQKAVKDKWTWTDRKRKDLSAEMEVNFASNGKIIGYRFKRSSGDARFDKSLTDAFIKLETLPKPLGKPHQETFLFNRDDLQGQ